MRNSARHAVLFFAGIAASLCIAALGTTVYNIFSPGGALTGNWNSQNVNLAAGSSFILNQLPLTAGGTGSTTASGARANLLAAASGANADITSITGLLTPLPVTEGGTNVATLTAHGVLLGEGTSSVGAVSAMSLDTLLQGNGASADPAAVSLVNCGDATHALGYSTSTHTFACQTITAGGSVSSVGLSAPSVFAVGGTPVTTSGTLALSFAAGQTPYQTLATPNNGTGALALLPYIISVETPAASPNVADDEFNENALDTSGTRFSGATAWTWLNQGSATATVAQGALTLSAPVVAGNAFRMIEQPISGAGKWRARITGPNFLDQNGAGLCFRNSANSKFFTFGVIHASGVISTQYIVAAQTWSSFTANVGSPLLGVYDDDQYGAALSWRYLEVQYDGTTLFFRLSLTGIEGTFRTLYTEAASNFLGTPDQVCIWGNAGGTNQAGNATADWFRRIS